MPWELLVPIAFLAVVIAIIRALGVLMVKPQNTRRVYTQPVISGSWGQTHARPGAPVSPQSPAASATAPVSQQAAPSDEHAA